MIAHGPEALFQVIIGRWQIWDIIAMKKPWGKAVGRFDEMVDGLGNLWVKLGLLCLEMGEPLQQASTDLSACEVLMIG
jgi:hypothetical protein